jgi:hypothetical protein
MASPRECIEFANQCVRLADLCKDDPQLREHLLELASKWMAMAAQESRPVPPAPAGDADDGGTPQITDKARS